MDEDGYYFIVDRKKDMIIRGGFNIGDGIEFYGCPTMSPVAVGLVSMELNRGDGSLGTFGGVQAGLAMQAIAMLGSEEQKQRWLPEMAGWTSWARSR